MSRGGGRLRVESRATPPPCARLRLQTRTDLPRVRLFPAHADPTYLKRRDLVLPNLGLMSRSTSSHGTVPQMRRTMAQVAPPHDTSGAPICRIRGPRVLCEGTHSSPLRAGRVGSGGWDS